MNRSVRNYELPRDVRVRLYDTVRAAARLEIERPARPWDRAVKDRWPIPSGYRVFLSASGAEAIEAGLKLCYVAAYKRFVERHGMDTLRRVQAELGVREVGYFQGDTGVINQIVHLWAYTDFNERAALRARLMAEPRWLAYVARMLPLLQSQESKFLTPAPFFTPLWHSPATPAIQQETSDAV